MRNSITFDEATVTKRYVCCFSLMRERYVYDNETNLGDVVIRGVVPFGNDALRLPYVAAQQGPWCHEQAGRLLADFHDAVYRTPFTSLEIPEGKMFVERKLVSLLEEYKGDRAISVVLTCAVEARTDLVLCHGDFSPRNIIVSNSGRLYLIDFEAVSLGPRAFDIAKYLWKCAENRGTRQGASVFIRAYERSARCAVAAREIDIYILVHALLAKKWLRATGIDDPHYHLLAQRTIARQMTKLRAGE
ncbi:phosphotransferase [Pseudomonas sp. KNUC1026]|uniref:phosphotransferase n=1 Tax=Pseudomonas sp. KNUC1026 TaxID=2893890 RepID=UPI001F330ED9|nr:phosphotransferase [Pseudomonas sp. KNUC1026]UFH50546.1 phosphotransferase [Pseudomonas sp. KNUC1026]